MGSGTVMLLMKLLDVALLGIEMLPAQRAQVDKLTAKLKQLAAENRDPTPFEWNEINAETDALMAQLQSAADRQP